ncbi:MAG: tRNA (adenine-N1)-methyltransferase [Chloroflexota bacterium]
MLTSHGDIIELVDINGRFFLVRLQSGQKLQTHRGVFNHDDLIGKEFGSKVISHTNYEFYLIQPSAADLVNHIKRKSQIMFPKDIGLIVMKLNVHPGMTILEAGSGSGGLTTALAHLVGDTGKVISYDVRDDMQEVARKNIESMGWSHRVDFKLRDIKDGFDETNIESLFLDVSNPYDYMEQVYKALRGGGHFGCLVPTTPQVSELILALQRNRFAFIEVLELMLRHYKPVPSRLRPFDRMVAHTGYLVFARPLLVGDQPQLAVEGEDER